MFGQAALAATLICCPTTSSVAPAGWSDLVQDAVGGPTVLNRVQLEPSGPQHDVIRFWLRGDDPVFAACTTRPGSAQIELTGSLDPRFRVVGRTRLLRGVTAEDDHESTVYVVAVFVDGKKHLIRATEQRIGPHRFLVTLRVKEAPIS